MIHFVLMSSKNSTHFPYGTHIEDLSNKQTYKCLSSRKGLASLISFQLSGNLLKVIFVHIL